MEKEKFMQNYNKFHFIGACGVSMSGLIKHLLLNEKAVTGSDNRAENGATELNGLGAKIYCKHSSKNAKNADVVIYSSAIKSDNPELNYAIKHKIPTVKRSELLGEILREFKTSVAVSGCHGKTTATAMIANVLINAKKDPTVFLGGEDYSFGNYRNGGKDVAVAEACEYKKNFLDVKPNISVVLNIDNDHMDAYKDMTEMLNAFTEFTKNTIAVINADDALASKIFNSTTVTFGIEKKATYMAKKLRYNNAGYTFTAYAFGRAVGTIKLKVAGRHNVYNALSAIAVCDVMNIPFFIIKRALENFKGVKRRNEYIGEFFGLNCYADYAHHPKEIEATLTAFSESGEDYVTVFQPHTYSRTKLLMDDFIKVLKDKKPLIVLKTYSAREEFDENGSAKTLFDKICEVSGENCNYVQDQIELKESLEKLAIGKKRAIFLGAGDVYDIAKNIIVQK